VNHSSKKQHHEQARKKHRHDQQEHARELAKQKRSMMPLWILCVGIGLMVVLLIVATVL
jgi:hypothetical protein